MQDVTCGLAFTQVRPSPRTATGQDAPTRPGTESNGGAGGDGEPADCAAGGWVQMHVEEARMFQRGQDFPVQQGPGLLPQALDTFAFGATFFHKIYQKAVCD